MLAAGVAALVAIGGFVVAARSANPPGDDIAITGCNVDLTSSTPQVEGRITNHTSSAHNYEITISFDEPDGTVVRKAIAGENGVQPGDSVDFRASGDGDYHGARPMTCRVSKVSRTASTG